MKVKEKLEQVIGFSVKEGRQHYLRFEVPTTWKLWSDNGMEMDCTLSYADKEGFRCSTCYEFPVFNILTRQQLPLKEYPLIVMEGSFTTYQYVMLDYMLKTTRDLLKIAKKYSGIFIFMEIFELQYC